MKIRLYNKVMAISEEDKNYIIELKKDYPKMSQAGILSYIINNYKKNERQNNRESSK